MNISWILMISVILISSIWPSHRRWHIGNSPLQPVTDWCFVSMLREMWTEAVWYQSAQMLTEVLQREAYAEAAARKLQSIRTYSTVAQVSVLMRMGLSHRHNITGVLAPSCLWRICLKRRAMTATCPMCSLITGSNNIILRGTVYDVWCPTL